MPMIQRIVLLVPVATIVASCGGTAEEPTPRAEPDATGPTTGRVTLTFSPDGCAYAGPSRAGSGLVDFEVTNQVGEDVHVDVWMMDGDYTFAEFSAHIDDERERIESGAEPVGPPGSVTLLSTIEVAGEATEAEAVAVREGTLGFACISFDGERGTIHLAGPLEVTA